MDEKLEKAGERLRNEMFAELKHALDHFNAEVWAIKQFLPGTMETKDGVQNPKILEVDFAGKLQKNAGSTLAFDTSSGPTKHMVHEPNSLDNLLDPSKINPKHNTLDCPRFDGYDFLGWHMKDEYFFEAIKIREEDKV